jgi:alpha-beta hydrolase superfamily lysophospholipase
VSRRKRADRVESALRRADATLAAWFRRGAGVVRRRIDGLQGGLKSLSRGLEQVEKDPKPVPQPRSERPTSSRRKVTRPRKTKKAA